MDSRIAINFDLAKASPLDELRNQSGYFPDFSQISETENGTGLSFNQDDSQSVFQGTNQSIYSFETVQTTERLLDRLDLSAEDEIFLQQALKEEKEKNEDMLVKQAKGPILCMPASKFPSLRTKYMSAVKSHEVKADKFSADFSNLRGDFSSSKVEQHYPAKSRYSYLVEEDIDLGSTMFETPTNPSEHCKVSERKRHPYRVEPRKHNERTDSSNQHNSSDDLNVVNFEKYRMENSKLARYYERLFELSAKQKKYHESTLMKDAPNKPYEYQDTTLSLKDESFYRDGSNSSTATSFAEPGLLLKPRTGSSMESDISSKTSYMIKEGSNDFFSTPTKNNSSATMDAGLVKDVSREPAAIFKSHKKKSSFSLKNLFKSPKAHKARENSETRASFEETKNIYHPDISSVDSSPRHPGGHLRKFIFPVNPIISFESETPSKRRNGSKDNSGHFRSLSDFNKSSSSDNPSKDKLDRTTSRKNFSGRRLSLDSKKPTKSPLQFQTPPHSRQLSENALQFNKKYISLDSIAAGPATDPLSIEHIETAINLRNEGKLVEFANSLHHLCLKKDLTAFLLYGLALRDGCGVQRDYKESLQYIKAATGVHSENEEIFCDKIDPFEIERFDLVPTIAPEPKAPALYECGMAYLNGLGSEKPDEFKGLKYLEKAASYGHIDSMCLSGTIWSKKTLARKKDIVRAAAWFRLAEKRGASLIGASWIHKEKYLNPSKDVSKIQTP